MLNEGLEPPADLVPSLGNVFCSVLVLYERAALLRFALTCRQQETHRSNQSNTYEKKIIAIAVVIQDDSDSVRRSSSQL